MTDRDGREADGQRSGGGRFSGERARRAGAKGGKARAARRLTLERVRAQLPAMDSADSIRRGLETIRGWVCAGLVTGSAGGAAVRSCEVALKALDSAATFEAIEELRESVRKLQAERDAALREVELAARPRLVP